MKLRAIALPLGVSLVLAAARFPAVAQPDCPPIAQVPSRQLVQAGLRNAVDRGFLWRITKASRSSYLYGTVHVGKFDWMFPGKAVSEALLASETIALELDMLDPDIQARLARAMSAHPGPSLSDGLATRLARQAQLACIDTPALARLNPMLQVTTLGVLAARQVGLDPAYGVDVFLAGFGRGAGKSVVSLEAPELQMKTLLGDEPAQLLRRIEEVLTGLEQGQVGPRLARIVQVWALSDHERLERYEEWCECADRETDRALLRRLLDERNPALAARIADLHEAGQRVFAAVGSLHMIGATGLPFLLRARGFEVERIEFQR